MVQSNPAEVGIVMLFGMVPGIFQFATEQLFVDPQILEVTLGRMKWINHPNQAESGRSTAD